MTESTHAKTVSQGKLTMSAAKENLVIGRSETIRTPMPEKLPDELSFEKKTLAAIFKSRGDLYLDYLGKIVGKKIEFRTYSDIQAEALGFIQWILKQGFENSSKTKVTFISDNSLQLRIISQGLLQSKIPIIPLYNALSEESVFDIIKSTQSQILVCDNDKKLDLLFSNIDILPDVKLIITTHECSDFKKPENAKVELKNYCHCLLPKDEFIKFEDPNPDDVCYLLCTSGSTGNPKLVVHTHLSLFSTVIGTAIYLNDIAREVNRNDENLRVYSMLPEAHILGLNSIMTITACFGSIVYPSSRDVKSVSKSDMAICQPTIWVVVPLILNRIYKTVNAELKKSSIKSALFNFSCNLSASFGNKNPLSFVFNKIRNGLGGKVKGIICAGALLDSNVHSFIELTTGARLCQGYGMTEGLIFLATPSNIGQHCGVPLPGMEVYLRDVPEMGYLSEKNQGEVCYKGPNNFLDYFNNETESKNILDENGYIMTGDIGEIGDDGNLRIIDRKKNIFKLAQGEYICISAIQEAYLEFEPIKDVYVHGNPLESSLVGIGFFDINEIESWLKSHMPSKDFSSAMDNAKKQQISILDEKSVHCLISKELNEFACGKKLKGFEKVRCWKFVDFLPAVENKLLTVTLKQKRAVFEQRFEQEFKRLYEVVNS